MKIATSVSLLFLLLQAKAQFKYGAGLYSIPFITPIGCPAELQSNNSTFDTTDLKKIIPILKGFPSENKGYYNEFGHVSIYPYGEEIKGKDSLKQRAIELFEIVQLKTSELKSLNILNEFDTLRKAHIHNRELKIKFVDLLLNWVKNEDDQQLRNELAELYENNETRNLLDSILITESWEEKFLQLHGRLGNHYNKLTSNSRILTRNLQSHLFTKYKIGIVHDPNCQD